MQVHLVHTFLVKGLQFSLDHHVDTVVHALDCLSEVWDAIAARVQEITSAFTFGILGAKLRFHFLRPRGHERFPAIYRDIH